MAIARLQPTSTQLNDTFSIVGAATVHAAVDDDPGPPEVPDDATTHVYRTATTQQRFRCGIEPAPSATSIASVTLYARGYNASATTSGWKLYIYVDSTNYDGTLQTNTSWDPDGTDSKTWTTNPATGDAWTKDEIDNIHIGFVADGEDPAVNKLCTMLFLEVDYTPLPAQISDTRTVGSQILRLRKQSPRTVTQTAPLSFLDTELLSDYALTHFAFPAADGGGAGTATWERRLMRLLRTELDLESMRLKATGFDLRPYLVSFWDIGQSKISAAANADGIARLDPGATRTFSRSSKAWIPDPGDGRIVQVAEDEEKYAENGMLIEGAASNYVKNSAFKDGVGSNWSAIASGTVASETDDVLFDTDVTAQAASVTGSSGDGIQQTATNTVANDVLMFSYDFMGDAHTWDLQESGGQWWNDGGGGAWQGSRPGNSQAASSSNYTRVYSNVITAPGASKTIAVEFRLTGATTEIILGHVQIEQNRWASSRIVTSSSTITRAADALYVSNDAGARTWNREYGSFKCQIIPNWNSADLAAGTTKSIIQIYYGATDYDAIYYWSTEGRWYFHRRVSSSNYYAYSVNSVIRGTTYDMGARWTSDEGELGLTDYTHSIFVDGVKGTDGTCGGSPPAAASANFNIGRFDAASYYADASIRYLDAVPAVLSDEEMAR
jgi:hypothetical protein